MPLTPHGAVGEADDLPNPVGERPSNWATTSPGRDDSTAAVSESLRSKASNASAGGKPTLVSHRRSEIGGSTRNAATPRAAIHHPGTDPMCIDRLKCPALEDLLPSAHRRWAGPARLG